MAQRYERYGFVLEVRGADAEVRGADAEVRGADARVGAVLEPFLRRFGFTQSQASGEPHARLSLSAGSGEHAGDLRDVLQYVTGVEAGLDAGGAVVARCPSAYLVTDSARGRCRGEIDVGALEADTGVRDQLVALLSIAIGLLMRARALYPIHAAALVHDGRGVLLAANSDSGKSTLAYGLVRAGWSFVSDDSLVLRRVEERVRAHAFRESFALDFEAQHIFPELAGAPRRTQRGREKWDVDVRQVHPERFRSWCEPRVLIVPEIAGEQTSRLEPLPTREALLVLIKQAAVVLLEERNAAAHVAVLQALVRQCRTYRLRAGRDVVASPETIPGLVGSVLPAEPGSTTYPAPSISSPSS